VSEEEQEEQEEQEDGAVCDLVADGQRCLHSHRTHTGMGLDDSHRAVACCLKSFCFLLARPLRHLDV